MACSHWPIGFPIRFSLPILETNGNSTQWYRKENQNRNGMNTFCILHTTHKIWKNIIIENKKSVGQCEQVASACSHYPFDFSFQFRFSFRYWKEMGTAPNEIRKKIWIGIGAVCQFTHYCRSHKKWKKIGIGKEKSDERREQAVTYFRKL